MALAPRDCPCFSGKRYAVCCGPIHSGVRRASTPEELMRSRYAAFARGLGAYLSDTLTADHPLLATPRDVLVRELSRAKDTQKFMGLRVVATSIAADGDHGEVIFIARIFERGVDRSFAERSRFVREEAAWKYASGDLVDRASLPKDLDAVTEGHLAPLFEAVARA